MLWKNVIQFSQHLQNFMEKLQGVSKKSGISKFLTFCVIPLMLFRSEENNSRLPKIKFIVVVLSIIDYLSFKRCSRY
jgi:hypothetical protein